MRARSLLLFLITTVASAQNPIGGGLEGIADWSRSNAFVDLVKQSRGFGPANEPWSGSVPVDANGWPTGDFGVILGVWPGMQNVGGTYKLRFYCNTTPTITPVASPGTIQNVVRNAQTGLVTADYVYPANGDQMMLKFTGTSGGVRHLSVLRPGTQAADVFTQPFLEHLGRFPVLRFMDWTHTNFHPASRWTERKRPEHPSYAGATGVPWEVCFDLANRLGKDAWINVPHMADDDYVRRLAGLAKSRLAPGLRLYVEYSNEVWNWSFTQATWNLDQAKIEASSRKRSDLAYDGETNDGVWAARRVARRTKQIADLFREVYGVSDFRRRVRPVLGVQVAWPGLWLHEGLKYLNERHGPPANYLYGVAVAPYFNLGEANNNNALTVTQVLAAMQASVNAFKTDAALEDCATLTRVHGMTLVAYEGGPDTFGSNSVAAKRDASLDPRIQAICIDYLKTWFGYTPGLFNWFVAGATDYNSNYGTWGLTDDMARQNAAKILALDEARFATTYPLTQGQLVPGQVDARRYAFRPSDWNTVPYLQYHYWDWRGRHRDYLFRSMVARTFDVDVLAGSEAAGTLLELTVDGSRIGALSVPHTGSWGTQQYTPKLRVTLPSGMHGLRVRLASDTGVSIAHVRFTGV